jgi:hypothetical protein
MSPALKKINRTQYGGGTYPRTRNFMLIPNIDVVWQNSNLIMLKCGKTCFQQKLHLHTTQVQFKKTTKKVIKNPFHGFLDISGAKHFCTKKSKISTVDS